MFWVHSLNDKDITGGRLRVPFIFLSVCPERFFSEAQVLNKPEYNDSCSHAKRDNECW
jgi:hypothetical protein